MNFHKLLTRTFEKSNKTIQSYPQSSASDCALALIYHNYHGSRTTRKRLIHALDITIKIARPMFLYITVFLYGALVIRFYLPSRDKLWDNYT